MKTFYLIALTQTFSIIGSQISSLALGIWVYQETGSATPLALTAFFSIVPFTLLSSFAGVIADRYSRKAIMALSDLGQAICTLVLLWLFTSGSFQIWHLYLVSLLQGIASTFQGPALSASITMLVPDDQRDRANAIRQMSQPAAGIIAPVVAGLVFAAIGVAGAIMIDLLTFAVAVVVILLAKVPMPRQSAEGKALSGTIMKEMIGGVRYLWARPGLFWLVVGFMVVNFILNSTGVLVTPYLLARTGDDATYGVLMGLFNTGGLIGAIAIGVYGAVKRRVRTIMIQSMIISVLIILFGMAQTVPALAIVSLLVLIPSAITNTVVGSLLQVKVAPDVQGRVFAVIDHFAMLLNPIAYLMAGPLADRVFEPMVGSAAWQPFAPFFGTGAGAGMGLMIAVSGSLALATILLARISHTIWTMEDTLPDYLPEPDEVAELAPASA